MKYYKKLEIECHDGNCGTYHYNELFTISNEKVKYVKETIDSIGIDAERFIEKNEWSYDILDKYKTILFNDLCSIYLEEKENALISEGCDCSTFIVKVVFDDNTEIKQTYFNNMESNRLFKTIQAIENFIPRNATRPTFIKEEYEEEGIY